MADNSAGFIRCEECGKKSPSPLWKSYWCPKCGGHSDDLYREEHHDPDRARFMNRADIIAEYHMAGMAFRAEGR
jgi:hypothetical protein